MAKLRDMCDSILEIPRHDLRGEKPVNKPPLAESPASPNHTRPRNNAINLKPVEAIESSKKIASLKNASRTDGMIQSPTRNVSSLVSGNAQILHFGKGHSKKQINRPTINDRSSTPRKAQIWHYGEDGSLQH